MSHLLQMHPDGHVSPTRGDSTQHGGVPAPVLKLRLGEMLASLLGVPGAAAASPGAREALDVTIASEDRTPVLDDEWDDDDEEEKEEEDNDDDWDWDDEWNEEDAPYERPRRPRFHWDDDDD